MSERLETKRCVKALYKYFSFPFSFFLMWITLCDGADSMPRWPQMYLEVSSLDSWQRYRIEGYGCVVFPQCPGQSVALSHFTEYCLISMLMLCLVVALY